MPLPFSCTSSNSRETVARVPRIPPFRMQLHKIQDFILKMRSRADGGGGGVLVQKYGRQGSPHDCTMSLEQNDTILTYSPSRHKNKPIILLIEIQEIRVGHKTNVFSKKGKPDLEKYAFSLVTCDGRSLDLEVSSTHELDMWEQCFCFLIRQTKDLYDEDPQRMKLMKMWIKSDQDGNHKLSLHEVKALFDKLNYPSDCEKAFKKYDSDNSNSLEFEEFEQMFRELNERKEIDEIFQKVVKQPCEFFMRFEQFVSFMKEDQGDATYTDEAIEKLKIFKNEGSPPRTITKSQFTRFLGEAETNSWMKPAMAKLHQNMEHPLTSYFINSSHNTYVSGDQLQSESKVEMYKNALLNGCRCVELDCWDGNEGEPIIYHGFTATSKISFAKVIECINDYAFTSSEFPVILSLEVHTSLDQQYKMAKIMKEVFKDRLAKPVAIAEPKAETYSPNFLKKKILIKYKMLSSNANAASNSSAISSEYLDDDIDFEGMPQEVIEARKNAPEKGPAKIHPDLSNMVFLKSVHLSSIQDGKERGKCYEVVSFVETKSKLLPSSPDFESFIEMTKKMLCRIYPKGTRIQSDNYNPCSSWNVGAQMVALNFQTYDFPLRLNEAMFRINGECGYVLKPAFLRERSQEDAAKKAIKYTLSIQVISGCQLPKPNLSNKGEIIDPFVRAIVSGAHCDNSESTSKTITDNGFNPRWDHTFTFTIDFLELAILTLRVVDFDIGVNDEIAEASIPVSALRQGYRCVPLHNIHDNILIEGASLFCHFRLAPRLV